MKKNIACFIAVVTLAGLAGFLIAYHDVTVVPPQNAPEIKSYTRTSELFPDGCAVLASQVNAELIQAGIPSHILFLRLAMVEERLVTGHAIVVWQPFPGAPILAFDHAFIGGTIILPVNGFELISLIPALQKAPDFDGVVILQARYLQ